MLLAAGSAAACNIDDFSVGSTAQCDISVGVAKAAITITDKDASGTPADITVYLHLANPAGKSEARTSPTRPAPA